ncbi:MAG: hypothetical protein EA355_07900 [Rhodobacteraceae bacterium]|nr:MAG: hypothetical protein EA355_07900 [Paracoccaceae bacterium]
MKPVRLAAGLVAGLALPAPGAAAPLCDDLGFAGLLAGCNKMDLPPLTLSAGKPIADGPLGLSSGVYYRLDIIADGTQELGLVGPDFFRAIWVDEVIVNDIEVRPMGLHSIEFDRAGTLRLTFIAIKPGQYELKIPGSTGETQRVDITIR